MPLLVAKYLSVVRRYIGHYICTLTTFGQFLVFMPSLQISRSCKCGLVGFSRHYSRYVVCFKTHLLLSLATLFEASTTRQLGCHRRRARVIEFLYVLFCVGAVVSRDSSSDISAIRTTRLSGAGINGWRAGLKLTEALHINNGSTIGTVGDPSGPSGTQSCLKGPSDLTKQWDAQIETRKYRALILGDALSQK